MNKTLIYTTPYCPFCVQAKALLDSKGAAYQEIDVSGSPSLRQEMEAKANQRHTVPQIFIGDHHIGGCDDLYALEQMGKLDALLGV